MKRFIKNNVYRVNGEKMICILADESNACLCPFTKHKNDAGYNTKMSKPAIYATDIDINGADVQELGYVKDGSYHQSKPALVAAAEK